MDLWPWDLWTPDGQMKADTAEILQTLEKGYLPSRQTTRWRCISTFHALEGSPFPERAALAADKLRALQRGARSHGPYAIAH